MTLVPERWDVGRWDSAHWDGQLRTDTLSTPIIVSAQNVTLRSDYRLAIQAETIAVNFNDVGLILPDAPPQAYTLPVATAAVTVETFDVTLILPPLPIDYVFVVDPSAIVVTGNDLDLVVWSRVDITLELAPCAVTITLNPIDVVSFPPPPGVLTFGRRVPLAIPW